MSKFDLKMKALSLRRKGESIGSIARLLGISKSTASIWCRDLALTPAQKEKLFINALIAGNAGRQRGADMNRKKREDAIAASREEAQKTLGRLSGRDLLIAGIALYWAEGSKSPSGTGFNFVNSDPKMILLAAKWLRDVCGIGKEEYVPRISINCSHKHRIGKVLSFWASLLELPESRFAKTSFIKTVSKKAYENHDSYFGVLSLRVRKSGSLKYKVLALIDSLKEAMSE